MSNQIEIRHLRYFLAVAEELHFRKAADRLFISQPGLSRQISQLEAALGVKLFIRTKRNVELTPSGQYLKDRTETWLNQLDFTFRSLRSIDKGEEGEVRIGFVGSAMQTVIPESLTKLDSKFPGIHTSLTEMSNHDQLNELEHDRLDIGFVRLNRTPADIESRTVFEDTFSVVLPADHFLDGSNFESVHQLAAEKFILFSSDYSFGYYDQIMSICEDAGFSPHVSHKSVHANTIFRLVENKLGVAIVPTTLQYGFDLKIRFIELKEIPQRTKLSAVWKAKNENPALKWYLEVL